MKPAHDLAPAPPPRGLLLAFFRFPVFLYRLGLGGLFGRRFLWFRHVGRKSGREYESVVEVIRRDRTGDVYVVLSGYGPDADWYRNLQAMPQTAAQCGFRRFMCTVHFPDEATGLTELKDYARRHPLLIRELARIIGYRIRGTNEEIEALSRLMPLVEFHPRQPGQVGQESGVGSGAAAPTSPSHRR